MKKKWIFDCDDCAAKEMVTVFEWSDKYIGYVIKPECRYKHVCDYLWNKFLEREFVKIDIDDKGNLTFIIKD